MACVIVRFRHMSDPGQPLVAVIMGSKSDWETMRHADEILTRFGVAHECKVMSAHRTPAMTTEYATGAEGRGIEVIIAAAGGAAHLAGVVAAHTILPVLGVPIESPALKGMDSLLSTVQMPGGIPVGTLAIGKPGAINAALLAVAILESWTALAALAGLTTRMRVGTIVSGNTYRHPAVLAKMAANIDVISGGRLICGMGAGWQENEHQAYGIPFYTVG